MSEWTERYRVLGPPSEERGPLRLRRTPYLVAIMNAFDDPTIEQVVLCKSAQIAGTEAMLSVVGKFAHEGQPIMVVMSDEDTAIYTSTKRIQPMFRNSPDLARLILEDEMNQKEITLANEAYIALAWASSVAKLASRPIRIMIFDEVDKPGYAAKTKEADAISLGIERTESYYNRKIGILSTPTVEEGNIISHLKGCDVIFDFHVPCPACGQHQPLRWSMKQAFGFKDGLYRGDDGQMHHLGRVVWEGGRDATPEQIDAAGYECGECHAIWTTRDKNNAVQLGKMVSRTDITGIRIRKIGFHINRLYSLLGKSGDISKLVTEWITVVKGGRPLELQGFINSTLAEPFKQVVEHQTESSILGARLDSIEPQIVPAAAVCLTAGIDVQKHEKWFAVRAWATDATSWLIHYGVLGTWEEVEELLFNTAYPKEGAKDAKGRQLGLPIRRAAIDTGGGVGQYTNLSMTEETELWISANRRRSCRVWGTKGSSHEMGGEVIKIGPPKERTASGKPLDGAFRLIMLNTGALKSSYHERIKKAIDGKPGGAYLHRETDDLYAQHVTAESIVIDRKTGHEAWENVHRRPNHLFDCECLAAACVDPAWPGGGLNIFAAARKEQGAIGAAHRQPQGGRRQISAGAGA